eukprot:681808-Rhodomonas_salina.1
MRKRPTLQPKPEVLDCSRLMTSDMTSKYNEWYKVMWKSPKPEVQKALNHKWYPARVRSVPGVHEQSRRSTHGCTQPASRANLLWLFTDADHSCNPDTSRSVTGHIMMLAGAAVSWQSTRQAVTALSSSEAEFYAASCAGCDAAYLQGVLEELELGFQQTEPTIVFEDNWVCIHMSRNLVLHHKTKHIDVQVYHLSDLCQAGVMSLLKICTNDMVADALTKALPRQAFCAHHMMMMMM